ncbi:hydantoinase/oxoprolinase family protein, partial [Rhizobiaceae sp. 2RAB30]
AQFAAEGVEPGKVRFLRYGKFRYQNQEHTTEVLIEGEVSDDRLAEIEAAFHETYEREYTYRLDAPVEMVGIHLVASAEVGKLTMKEREGSGADTASALKGERDVDYALEGIHMAKIYDGTKLQPSMRFVGPAIVEDPGTTVVIHPGNQVEIDGFGNIHIHLKA